MNLLLDTVIFLRLASEPERVPASIRDAIDAATTRFLSTASMWEMSIKASLGKLDLPLPVNEYIANRMEPLMLQSLFIEPRHAAHVQSLPFHHRDPFDRLLIAQAIIDDLTVVTTDPAFSAYNVRLIDEVTYRDRLNPGDRRGGVGLPSGSGDRLR